MNVIRVPSSKMRGNLIFSLVSLISILLLFSNALEASEPAKFHLLKDPETIHREAQEKPHVIYAEIRLEGRAPMGANFMIFKSLHEEGYNSTGGAILLTPAKGDPRIVGGIWDGKLLYVGLVNLRPNEPLVAFYANSSEYLDIVGLADPHHSDVFWMGIPHGSTDDQSRMSINLDGVQYADYKDFLINFQKVALDHNRNINNKDKEWQILTGLQK